MHSTLQVKLFFRAGIICLMYICIYVYAINRAAEF